MLLSLTAEIADKLAGNIGYNRMKSVYKVMLAKTIDLDAIKGYNRKLYQTFSAVLRRGLEQGEFNSVLTPETLAKHFVMALRGLTYEWCIRYPDFDLKENALVHMQILLSGITRENA